MSIVKMSIVRGMSAGDVLVFPCENPSYSMKDLETMMSRGYGEFTQKKVIVVDDKNLTVACAVQVTCVIPFPDYKQRGRPQGVKNKPKKEIITNGQDRTDI